jgi:DNA-binding NarL/FixJ family response regulator
MEPTRLVIADDHAFYREGIRTLSHTVADIEVIGEAATGQEVLAQAHALQPDVILMDIKMPGLNGIEAIFSPAIARRMIQYFAALPKTASALAFRELTEREREILQLMARGLNNVAIAHTLGLSLKTVQNHVSNIFVKLQVADRAQAIVRAHEVWDAISRTNRLPEIFSRLNWECLPIELGTFQSIL